MTSLFKAAILSILFISFSGHSQELTPLHQYVQKYDPSYNYRHVRSTQETEFSSHLLNMNSQTWRKASEVTPSLWNHWMGVIVPSKLKTTRAILLIIGGSFKATPPEQKVIDQFAAIAMATGSLLAIIGQIPGQPLKFADLDQSVREDALIAYSWKKAMQSGDPKWSAYLPMTKAAVRAMDTIQDYAAKRLHLSVSDFVVTGFSKRGATAWLTAAVDSRVSAVSPSVFNVLHLADQMEHQYKSYGTYSDDLKEYITFDVLPSLRSPEGKFLLEIVDPINYTKWLKMPHYVLNTTGDEFFTPDSSERYIKNISNETLQRIIPNTNHSFKNKEFDGLVSLIAWYQSLFFDQVRPKLDWKLLPSGRLQVSTSQTPLVTKLWQATNPKTRDFRRYNSNSPRWSSKVILPKADGTYSVFVPPPSTGYTAFMVELTFPGASDLPQIYTTSVFITPQTLPFKLKTPIEDPRGVWHWRRVISQEIKKQNEGQISTILNKLPLKILGTYINSPKKLLRNLSDWGPKAKCTASRLNIESHRLGWHSLVDRKSSQPIKSWELMQMADFHYSQHQPLKAGMLCQKMNFSY